MRGRLERETRNIIPRWRPFAVAARTDAELSSTRSITVVQNKEDSDVAYWTALRDFQEGQSVWEAGDLLALAVSRNDHAVARRVADFIATQGMEASGALRDMIAELAIRNVPSPATTAISEVRALRRKLSDFPSTAIAWADLALYLTLTGSFNKADRAIRTALQLAPNNRFILRAASRFYLHHNRPDYAHRVLRCADATPHDPWLLAAEIATARSAHLDSHLIRRGRKMLDDQNFSSRHLSELASAIGTTEGDSPTARRLTVRRFIAKSLIDPTENSVAQAQWHATNTGFSPPFTDRDTRTILNRQNMYEAWAWQLYIEGDFHGALHYARRWFDDQPFSARPAFLASQVASLLCQDPRTAVQIAKQALIPNPDESMLWNNLAYAHAVLGEIDSARVALNHINTCALDELSKLYVTATKGAISFRSGNSEHGRELYVQALNQFEKAGRAHKDFGLFALAFAHLAYEEAVAGSPDALNFYNTIQPLTGIVNRSDLREIVRMTRERIVASTDPAAEPLTFSISEERREAITG